MFKHLLVATDGSELSSACVDRAISFASETGARITFFCAEQLFPTMYYGMGAIIDPHAPTLFREEVDSVARAILDAAETKAVAAGVKCSTQTLACAEPYEAIIEAARKNGCDLIFMASHGRRGINALLLGSETQKVLTHSKTPVLIYR